MHLSHIKQSTLKYRSKVHVIKTNKNPDKQFFTKIRNFFASNDSIKKVKDDTQNGRKFLHIMYLHSLSPLYSVAEVAVPTVAL